MIQSFLSLLSSLTFALDTSAEEKWSELVSKLKNTSKLCDPTSQDIHCTVLAAWRDNCEAVKDLLVQVHNCLNTHGTSLGEVKDRSGQSVLSLLGECFNVMMEAVSCEEKDLVIIVGKGLVYTASVLLHLLAPCGHVDPVEKAAIKLCHFRKEVRDGNYSMTFCS